MENYDKLFDTICRVCLKYENNEDMVSLTDKLCKDGLSCYGQAFATLTNIPVKNDQLPNKICQKCLLGLQQAVTFKKNCAISEKMLGELLKSLDVENPNFKKNFCDYVMFTDFFADVNLVDKSKKPPKLPYPVEIMINNEAMLENEEISLENDQADLLHEFEDVLQSDSRDNTKVPLKLEKGDENIDELLDEMDKLIDLSPESSNINHKKYPKRKLIRKKSRNQRINKQSCRANSNKGKEQKSMKRKRNNLQCNICNKILSNLVAYNGHLARHNKDGKFICEQCGKKFVTSAELQYHLASSHNIGPQLSCKQCDFKTPKRYELMEHERIHTGERPYACDKCGLTFRRRYIWKKHSVYHLEKTIQCPQCPKKFYQQRDVNAHINNCHERTYMFACSQCDVTYAKITTVRRHLLDKHGIARDMQGKVKRLVFGTGR